MSYRHQTAHFYTILLYRGQSEGRTGQTYIKVDFLKFWAKNYRGSFNCLHNRVPNQITNKSVGFQKMTFAAA